MATLRDRAGRYEVLTLNKPIATKTITEAT